MVGRLDRQLTDNHSPAQRRVSVAAWAKYTEDNEGRVLGTEATVFQVKIQGTMSAVAERLEVTGGAGPGNESAQGDGG